MCYTGECRFECGYTGECMISNYQDFEKKYGETACIVGGMVDDEETEEYIAKNKERLEAIYYQWWEDSSYRNVKL